MEEIMKFNLFIGIIIILSTSSSFAKIFYSIDSTTDELITINFDSGDIDIIGSILKVG